MIIPIQPFETGFRPPQSTSEDVLHDIPFFSLATPLVFGKTEGVLADAEKGDSGHTSRGISTPIRLADPDISEIIIGSNVTKAHFLRLSRRYSYLFGMVSLFMY